MVSITEAAKCRGKLPDNRRCGEIGKLIRSNKAYDDDGELCDVAVYHCVNPDCTWFNTGWVVQSNDRGEVYERDQGPRGQDKTFRAMSPDQLAYGRRMMEDIARRDLDNE